MILRHLTVTFDQAFAGKNVGDPHHRTFVCGPAQRFGDRLIGQQRRVEQAVGIVECRAEQLAAGQVLVGRRNAALDLHFCGIDRHRHAETRQGGAVGTQDKDRLDHVSARLAHSKSREFPIVERGFRHDAVDREGRAGRRSGRSRWPAETGRRGGGRREVGAHWR